MASGPGSLPGDSKGSVMVVCKLYGMGSDLLDPLLQLHYHDSASAVLIHVNLARVQKGHAPTVAKETSFAETAGMPHWKRARHYGTLCNNSCTTSVSSC